MATRKNVKFNNKKNSVKNETKKNKLTKIVTIFIILIGIIFYAAVYRHEIVNKAEDLAPSGFSYPTDYEEYVVKYSKKYNVDPVLVFSVIKVESGFDPNAQSEVDARGLMQIMNDAYDWLKFRLNDDRSHSFEDMYDPELNIEYGSYYLSYLMDKYDNSIDLTAAAYHCGMNQVDSWLESGTIDKDNFNVDDIPDQNDQTAHYINKINNAYNGYTEVLSEAGIIE